MMQSGQKRVNHKYARLVRRCELLVSRTQGPRTFRATWHFVERIRFDLRYNRQALKSSRSRFLGGANIDRFLGRIRMSFHAFLIGRLSKLGGGENGGSRQKPFAVGAGTASGREYPNKKFKKNSWIPCRFRIPNRAYSPRPERVVSGRIYPLPRRGASVGRVLSASVDSFRFVQARCSRGCGFWLSRLEALPARSLEKAGIMLLPVGTAR